MVVDSSVMSLFGTDTVVVFMGALPVSVSVAFLNICMRLFIWVRNSNYRVNTFIMLYVAQAIKYISSLSSFAFLKNTMSYTTACRASLSEIFT